MAAHPRHISDYPDRQIDCEAAMEPLFQDMLEAMCAAGWTPRETERAVTRLNAASRLTRIENAKTETEIAIIRAMDKVRR